MRRALQVKPGVVQATGPMHSSKDDLVGVLSGFSGERTGDLQALEEAICAAVLEPRSDEIDTALFGLFERFPAEDGHGVFWSIVHGLERRGAYEESLLASVQRSPSPFSLRMLNRLMNSGQELCAGVPIGRLLEDLSAPGVPPLVQQEASSFLAHRRQRGDQERT